MTLVLKRGLIPAMSAVALLGQPVSPASQPNPHTTVNDWGDVFAREFKNRLFIIQHRSPKAMYEAVIALCSGARGHRIEYIDRDGVKAISVRDFPENIATIEAALKRLDVPVAAATAPEVELHIHVLFASKAEGSSEGLPDELKDVVKSLKATLAYRSFMPVTSFVNRVRDDTQGTSAKASAEQPSDPGGKTSATLQAEYYVQHIRISPPSSGPAKITLHGFSTQVAIIGTPFRAEVRTDLTLKDGEKVVVGTSTLRDRGLIVVLTATVLK